MKANGKPSNVLKRMSCFAAVLACLFLVSGNLWAADMNAAGDTDLLDGVMEESSERMGPLKKIGSAIVWNGAVTVEDDMVLCAGLRARIIFDDAGTDVPGTRFVGIGGEPVDLTEMDLTDLHVNIALTSTGEHVVRWIVQGPFLELRGRITELDGEYQILTVQGIPVAMTAHTRLRRLRIFYPNQPIRFADLKTGTPVRVIAHFLPNGQETYLGLGVLAVMPNHSIHEGDAEALSSL